MATETKTVAMDGAAWTVPFICYFSRDAFVKRELSNKHIFPGKPDEKRAEMLGQVWDIAKKMEDGNGGGTVKKSKRR